MGKGTRKPAKEEKEQKENRKTEMKDRKEKILGKKQNPKVLWVIVAVLLVAAVPVIWSTVRDGQAGSRKLPGTQVMDKVNYSGVTVAMTPVEAAVGNGTLEIPLGTVKEKKLVSFSYLANGRKMPLMAYITPKGRLVTAVSICEPCKSTKFHIEGNQMVCNACGTRWDLESLEGVSGGCLAYPPDAFAHTVQGNKVMINEAAVANWRPRI